MPSNTPNHGYNRPDKGATDWHAPLNDNFVKMDTDVPVWDIDENKGNYSPASGGHFIATDTGAIYEGDGSAWSQIGSIDEATSSTFSGQTGIRVADDAADIQRHLDELDGANNPNSHPSGGVVLLKRKIYQPSDPIVMRRGTHLVGQQLNYEKSGFVNQTANEYCLITNENLPAGTDVPVITTVPHPKKNASDACSIQKVGLRQTGNQDQMGIYMNNINSALLKHVMVYGGFSGDGLRMKGVFDGHVQGCSIDAGNADKETAALRTESDAGTSRDCQVWASGSFVSDYRAVWHNSSTLKLYGGTGKRTKLRCSNGSGTSASKPGAGLYNGGKGRVSLQGVFIETKETNDTYYIGAHLKSEAVRWHGGSILDGDIGIKFENSTGRFSQLNDIIIEGINETAIDASGSPMPMLNSVTLRNCDGDGIVAGNDIRVANGLIKTHNISGTAFINNTSETFKIGIWNGTYTGDPMNDPSKFYIPITGKDYSNTASGSVTQTASSSPATFTVNHNMDESPAHVQVTPRNSGSAGPHYWDNPSDTSFDVTFTEATGGDTVSFDWQAYGASAVQ